MFLLQHNLDQACDAFNSNLDTHNLMTASKYAFFSVLAIAVNLITQWQFFAFFDGFVVLYIALVAGTLTGLITKYVLDKRWIFYCRTLSLSHEFVCFGFYSLTGVFTTMVFWGTEMSFYYLFEFSGSQYVGGALGLCIGYTAKYFLDKRFVFRKNQ